MHHVGAKSADSDDHTRPFKYRLRSVIREGKQSLVKGLLKVGIYLLPYSIRIYHKFSWVNSNSNLLLSSVLLCCCLVCITLLHRGSGLG